MVVPRSMTVVVPPWYAHGGMGHAACSMVSVLSMCCGNVHAGRVLEREAYHKIEQAM
jgi:hypothetical protein